MTETWLKPMAPDNNAMHVKSGLACDFFCLQDYRPDSVIVAVMWLRKRCIGQF